MTAPLFSIDVELVEPQRFGVLVTTTMGTRGEGELIELLEGFLKQHRLAPDNIQSVRIARLTRGRSVLHENLATCREGCGCHAWFEPTTTWIGHVQLCGGHHRFSANGDGDPVELIKSAIKQSERASEDIYGVRIERAVGEMIHAVR